jgi:hypothetical protein
VDKRKMGFAAWSLIKILAAVVFGALALPADSKKMDPAASSSTKALAEAFWGMLFNAMDLHTTPHYYYKKGGMKSFPQPFFPPDSLRKPYEVCKDAAA